MSKVYQVEFYDMRGFDEYCGSAVYSSLADAIERVIQENNDKRFASVVIMEMPLDGGHGEIIYEGQI